ncbi:MAG TPA: proline iminopeptidase-family hydrolase [Gaiellaceae bacterium]
MSQEHGSVEVEGGTVRYRVLGEGERTLVLLHGGPGAGSLYLKPLEGLAGPDRRVVVYDQLGCGASDCEDDPSLWRADRFVDELETLRAHLGLEGFDLYGHSWGGMLATDYALAHQEHLRSLVLASTIADAALLRREMDRLLESFPDELRETLRRHEEAGTTDSQAYQDAIMAVYHVHVCRCDPWPPEVVKLFEDFAMNVYVPMWGPSEFFYNGNLADWDRVDRLAEIRVPTLITVGLHDELTPACSEQIHERLPDSRLVVFEHGSHLTFWEETERYLQVVDEFLRREDVAEAGRSA